MRIHRFLVSLTGLFLFLASPLFAGMLIVETRGEPGAQNPATTRIQIDKGRVRVDTSGGSGPQAFIFRGDRQLVWIVNTSRKTYMEMTRQDLERLSSQLGGAMEQMRAQMEAQLKNMPAEQRKMIEERMAGMGAPAAVTKTVYKRTRSDKEGSWTCDVYEGYQGTEKVQEVCTVDFKALGMNAEDFKAVEELGEFFRSLGQRMGGDAFQMGSTDWEKLQGFPGVPVRRVSFANGKPQSTSRITEARNETFADALFEIPAGFQKEAFPSMGARP